jgi:hypothetical protein
MLVSRSRQAAYIGGQWRHVRHPGGMPHRVAPLPPLLHQRRGTLRAAAARQPQHGQQEQQHAEDIPALSGPQPLQQAQQRKTEPGAGAAAAGGAPSWLQRGARLLAGSLFFLAAAAAGPATGPACAAALQPPPASSTATLAARGRGAVPSGELAAAGAAASSHVGAAAPGSSGGAGQADRDGGGSGGGGATTAVVGGSGSDAGSVAPEAELLPAEQRVVAIFEANRPSVVNVSHVRSMHHFHTLDLNRMAVGQGSGFIWDRAGGPRAETGLPGVVGSCSEAGFKGACSGGAGPP